MEAPEAKVGDLGKLVHRHHRYLLRRRDTVRRNEMDEPGLRKQGETENENEHGDIGAIGEGVQK